MRFRFKPPKEQRQAIRLQQARLGQAGPLLKIVRSSLPSGFEPASVTGSVQSAHPDRFVMRVQVRSAGADERAFAAKVYSDDFGEQVWALARSLPGNGGPYPHGLCLPTHYVPHERALVFPWVAGAFLSDIVDERKPELLRQAARLAAGLHSLPIVPDAPSMPRLMLDDALARCERLRVRWPAALSTVEPLLDPLREAFARLEPFEPALVHGDLSAGQFLWTGERLVLLDLDMFGYTDPAYDAGHFLGQLERRCLLDSTLPAHAAHWAACFRDTYGAAMPQVSPRNIAFYEGLTLIRKIYTLCRTRPEGPAVVPPLGRRARAALEEAASGRRGR
jgi:tRNA A-37 threonylcarbamoyl transferase component Bud32